MKEEIKKIFNIRKLAVMFAGALLYGVGVALFLDPLNLAPGGFTGIAVIINKVTGWDTGIMVFVFNIPLMIAGLIRFGKEFLASTIWSVFWSSLSISVTSNLMGGWLFTENYMLAAVIGGGMMGVGLGLVFREGGTTGGTDIIIRFLRQKYKAITSGAMSVTMDSVVIIVSVIVFHNVEIGLYAAIACVVNSIMLNRVLYGTDSARMVFVISKSPQAISDRLLDDLSVGVTYIFGEGAFTEQKKKVILCVVKPRIFPKVKEIVREEDPSAFMIVCSAGEIYGEGFKKNTNIEL